MKSDRCRVRVDEVVTVGERIVLAIHFIGREPSVGTFLQCENETATFRIVGIGFISAEKWQEGVRNIMLRREKGKHSIKKGDELYYL